MQLRAAFGVVDVFGIFIGRGVVGAVALLVTQTKNQHVRHAAGLHDVLRLEDGAVVVYGFKKEGDTSAVERPHPIANAGGVAARPGVKTNSVSHVIVQLADGRSCWQMRTNR